MILIFFILFIILLLVIKFNKQDFVDYEPRKWNTNKYIKGVGNHLGYENTRRKY